MPLEFEFQDDGLVEAIQTLPERAQEAVIKTVRDTTLRGQQIVKFKTPVDSGKAINGWRTRFENGGEPEHYIGSADWMKRNLNSRVETVAPVEDAELKSQLDAIIGVYENDNCSVWDCGPDGVYTRREPAGDEPRRAVQEELARLHGDVYQKPVSVTP